MVAALAALGLVPVATQAVATAPGGDSSRAVASLDWLPCGTNPKGRPIECSSIQVPRNYARPGGPTITVGVARMQPKNPNGRFLFINGGGPGINGSTWLMAYSHHLPDAVTRRFTVIGMDPRGLPSGTLLPCYPTAPGPYDAFVAALNTPPRRSQELSTFRTLRDLGPSCRRERPRLTPHMGSDATARDMELLRRQVGARRLDFLGISYGTRLGATYADLFPRRVGRMVLDSVTPPNRTWWQLTGDQAAGFEASLHRWAQRCPDRATCPFPGRSRPRVQAQLRQSLRALPYGARRQLTGNLAAVLFDGDPYRQVDRMLGPQPVTGSRVSHAAGAEDVRRSQIAVVSTKWATVCADGPSPREPLGRFRSQLNSRQKQFPVFGARYSWLGAVCQGFPERQQVLGGDPHLDLMLLNGRDDPATPLKGARALRRLFPASTLTVWQGRGHSATEHDGCKRPVAQFLLLGRRPGPTCR